MEKEVDKGDESLVDTASSGPQPSVDSAEDAESSLKNVSHHPIVPRTVNGTASLQNKGAVQWNGQGLLAYAANCTVFVVDTKTVQVVQTLEFHKSVVKKILWVPYVDVRNDSSPLIQLITSDASGHVVHWDISLPTVLGAMQDGNKPVIGLEWVPGCENDLIAAALHSPYFLIIWDVKKQTKIWKKNFTDSLLSFSFDPFDRTKIAFLCPDCVLFIDDFQVGKIPASNGRKFYISHPEPLTDDVIKGRDRLKKLMKGLVVGETKPKSDEAMTISECLQLSYHKSMRHHLLLLYPRDILLIDLQINQMIGIIPVERTMPPLIQVYSARQRDVLYCLHESGSVSVKIRKKNHQALSKSPMDAAAESPKLDFGSYSTEMFVCYENKCQSEIVRQMKSNKVLGISVNPSSEKHIALFLSSGKIIFLELEQASPRNNNISRTITELITPKTPDNSNFRLLSMAVLSNINGNITIIKMCPPRTNKNKDDHIPFLAVGTTTGYVYIYNLSIGTVHKEFALHNYPVRGLAWTDLTSLITYAYSDGRKVKNELFLTDICTGYSIPFRTDKSNENPINLVRVSPLSKYFVIAINSGPFELWDLSTLTLLRTMTKKFPTVVALEWSPIYSSKSVQAKKEVETNSGLPQVKEHLVISDNESQLYHFAVNADGIKDGIKIPAVNSMPIISIAFKSNQLVRADIEGVLRIWDLKTRQAKNVPMNRGPIRYIRFAPGKFNMKLLVFFSDGFEIIKIIDDKSANPSQKVASFKLSKDSPKIIDVDWANSEFPVVAMEDGSIRILDTYLISSASQTWAYRHKDEICSPTLFPPKIIKSMQFLLCLQQWKDQPNYESFNFYEGISSEYIPRINTFLSLLDIGSDFPNLNIAEKCLRLARLLGDRQEIDLWAVALHYLQVYAARKLSENKQEMNKNEEMANVKNINEINNIEPLDTCFDYLMDSYSYQLRQLERVSLHEWKRGDYRYTQKVVEKLILLGETDRAVQLLLETDIDNPNYYSDAMKACLVATIQQTGAAQSTIKLVATNLIANGKVWEGVQLLCLIGKGLIGCKYLVSYGMWDSAVWLAKSILPPAETLEIMSKFSEHLLTQGDSFSAVLVQLSQMQFELAIQISYNQRRMPQAFLLLMSCIHFGVKINKDLRIAVQKAFIDNLKLIGYREVEKELGEKLLKCDDEDNPR
ncbi:WD repeat-containing protein 11-like [Cimex lectularius]|uniref:Uncharacterized protein n=1 Tax=Cimex lectularius TaxID=79782 RepID=A0A8I6RYV6_CIMLE|nr:WD repeat-containing protein 11-like [Cimex lectularius]